MDFFLCGKTIKPGRIVHQQAPLRQRGGGKSRHKVHEVGLVGLMRSIGMWKIGAPEHTIGRSFYKRLRDRHRCTYGGLEMRSAPQTLIQQLSSRASSSRARIGG